MRLIIALGGILFLAGMLFILTRANPIQEAGPAPVPVATHPRDHMGNAYLTAAQTQQALVNNQWDQARQTLDTTRRELEAARAESPQPSIDKLIQTTKDLDAMIAAHDPVAPLTARRLTYDVSQVYNTLAGLPATNFSAPPQASSKPELPPAPVAQRTPIPAPPAMPAELTATLATAEQHAARLEAYLRQNRYHRAWLELDRLRASLVEAQAHASPEIDRLLRDLDTRAASVEQGRRADMLDKTHALQADLRRLATAGGGGGPTSGVSHNWKD